MQHQIGTHELVIEGDVLKLITRGVFTLTDMKQFLELAEKNEAVFGYRLVLHDLSAAKDLTTEARKYTAERVRQRRLNGGRMRIASAAFGFGLVARAMMTLLYAMLRLTSKSEHISYLAGSEADARAFLAEQRRYFQSELKLP